MKLTRSSLLLPSVESHMLPGQVGYVNVDALSPATVKESAVVQKLQKDGRPEAGPGCAELLAGHSRRWRRGRPICSSSKGRIAYLQGQKVPRQDFDADPGKAVTALPPGGFDQPRDGGRGRINGRGAGWRTSVPQVVGERTYGDGAVRKAIAMDDGGAIILSVAKYYAPNGGKAIQDAG